MTQSPEFVGGIVLGNLAGTCSSVPHACVLGHTVRDW